MILARLSTGWDIEPREGTGPSPTTVSAELSGKDGTGAAAGRSYPAGRRLNALQSKMSAAADLVRSAP